MFHLPRITRLFTPLTLLALAATGGLTPSAAFAQVTPPAVIIGNDATTNEPFQVYDVTTGTFSTLSNGVGRCTGLTYDQATQELYVALRGVAPTATTSRLFKLALNPVGSLTLVGNYNSTSSTPLINNSLGGIAWDPVSSRLFAAQTGTIWLVNPADASNAPLRVISPTSVGLKGIDVDPVTGELYFIHTGSSTVPGLSSTGVYRISPPIESGPIVRVGALPLISGNPDTNVEGVAVGGGYVWISARTGTSLYRLRLSDGTYETPITVPFGGTGAASGGTAFVGAAVAGPDLGVAIRNGAETVVPAAGESVFNVTLRNVGTTAATSSTASIVLPGGVSFVSATNGATFGSGTVSFSAGDLAANAAATFSVTLSSAAPFTATVTGATTASDVYTGNNSASALSTVGSPDIVLTITPPAACTVGAGQEAAFSISVANAGASAVNSVVIVPVPSGAMFTTATPAGMLASGVVSIDLGTVAAGATVPVTIRFIPGDGLLLGVQATALAGGDANPANNTASAQAVTALFSSNYPAHSALLATNASSATVPGMVGSLVAGRTIDSVRSANGQWLITRWQASTTNQDDVLLRTSLPLGATTVIAQEGTTTLPNGQMPVGDTFTGGSVNNAGDYAFSGRAAGGLDYMVKSIGGVSTMIAFEGDPAPAITGGTAYGAAGSSVHISNTNVISYIWNFTGLTAATDEFALTQNNSVVLYQDGATVPGTGGPQTDIQNVGFYTSADGTRYLYEGRSNISGTKTTAVVGTSGGSDQTALIIQGSTLPGLSSPTAAIPLDGGTVMTAEGRWFVRGTNDDGDDWVISGTGNTVAASNVILRTGPTGAPVTPIIPGSSELWSPGGTAVMGIWANTANPRGDVLIVGETTGPSASNFVFVLNGTTVLAREGDPVDTNNNGMFDEDAYIRGLQARDTVVLTDEAMYAVVTLRDRTGVCSDAATTASTALIRIPIPQPSNVNCCRGTTCVSVASGTCTGTVGNSASLAVGTCGPNNQLAHCCYADYDHSGTSTIDDLFIYINTWLLSSPYTKIDGNTTTAPSIDDLFIFINLWLLGCQP